MRPSLPLALALASALALPGFGAVYFREQFLDGAKWQERWVLSQHKPNYGKFRLSAGSFYGDRKTDKGLQTSENLKFYAISSRFKPFSNKGRPLIIQYTVKHEQKIDCGGGYVKIFPSDLNQKNMSGESQYYIMFGPDICGSDTKKVHVILNYKSKLHLIKKEIRCKHPRLSVAFDPTENYFPCILDSCKIKKEEFINIDLLSEIDGFTHLYTLILRPDHTYKVKIDNEVVASGILEDDWDFLPPRRINDPAVKKPENWDDEAEIDDPNDRKPEDWNIAEHIVDNSAEKPEDWDDLKQGAWQPPMLKNPLYRGEWKPRKIPNPNYRGIWPHPQIENPAYVPDMSILVYENISVIGLDLWQVRSGTVFDNFLITDDETYAEGFGDETWGRTKGPEQHMNQKQLEEETARAREEERRLQGRGEGPPRRAAHARASGGGAEKEEL